MNLDSLVLGYRYLREGLKLARARPTSSFTTADLIERQAAARADHTFCRYADRVVSYREYNAEANRIAHWGVA